MITTKERARRFKVRLKTLFNIPEYNEFSYKVNGKLKRSEKISNARIPVKIPNFWYDPFELYVLAHIQRAHFIMTCNEWAYVGSSVENARYFKRSPYQRQWQNEYVTKQFEQSLRVFSERIEKKDKERNENPNTQTESNN
jgi:hypothetical protein